MLDFAKKSLGRRVNSNSDQKQKLFSKMRNKFYIVFLFISLIFLFLLMVFNYRATNKLVRNGIIELANTCSVQNAEALDLFFTRHEDILLTTAEVLEYQLNYKNASLQDVEKVLHNIANAYNNQIFNKYTNTDFTGIYAAVNGQLVHSYKTLDDLPEGYDPTKRQWYKEAISGDGKVIFGEPYLDIYSPNMVMTATKMLNDGKTVIGMDLTLTDLQFAGGRMDIFLTINNKQYVYGHGFILTDKGIVMAHSDESKQGENFSDPDNPMHNLFLKIRRCIEDDIPFFETNVLGVNSCVFPHQLGNGWYVVTIADLDDISHTMSDYSKIVSSGTSIIIFFIIIYSLLITRSHLKSEKLADQLKTALDLAKKDGLTGHANRTAYDIRIKELYDKINTPKDESFAIVMMDLNDLKYVNDHYGHSAGDQYIRNSCFLVRRVVACEIYRFGGDEFALFLTGKFFDQRDEIIANIKKAVAEGNSLLVPNVEKPSIALGMSVHHAKQEDDMLLLLRQADSEMYINKAEIKKARLNQSQA